jgi:hypothetical protein
MTQLYIRPLFGWHFFRKARAEPLLADLTRPRAPNPNPRPTNRPGATEAAPTLPVAPKCGVARNHRAAAHTPPPYSLNFRARGLSADPPVQPGASKGVVRNRRAAAQTSPSPRWPLSLTIRARAPKPPAYNR